MKGNRMGIYECGKCGDKCYVSDAYAFAGVFRPAAVLDIERHPVYWRDEYTR